MATFPNGRRFAFTVFDDTDFGTVENLRPVYNLLDELGLHTTKSVWPLNGPGHMRGETLQHRPYAEFVLDLRERGFELALHGVQDGSAERPRIEQGLAHYRSVLDEAPRLNANHSRNRDNLYWGGARVSHPGIRAARGALTLARRGRLDWFSGERPTSPYFWGDLYQESIEYTRNLAFDEINLDRINPSLPYRDPARPFSPYWYSACEGGTVDSFCETLSEANQERLEAEGGVCIIYAHFGCGFAAEGRPHPRFAELLRRLARRDGWFVPVGTLLDHLRAQRGGELAAGELATMERHWFSEKVLPRGLRLRDNLSRGQRPAHQATPTERFAAVD